MKEKMRLGISSCLLGEKVRYDGGHRLDYFLKETLGNHVEWVAVCPEVEYGLPVPRDAMRLEGDPTSPRLVTMRTRIDHTAGMLKWARKKVRELEGMALCGFVFKSKSPSSGMQGVKVYGPTGAPLRSGIGLFAKTFMEHFPLLPVEDEGRLQDPSLRENFIERIFVFHRWRQLMRERMSAGGLVSFHADHKLLILSHSTKHYSVLGRLIADAKRYRPEELYRAYITTLMEGLRLAATARKNTNVLLHVVGYFKKELSPGEKQELIEVIDHYHTGFLPLTVPVTLLNHYVRKYNEPYLKRQWYLNPHPVELMLRNHA
jgi:uncharacterized protein YbgA (DUF1722 family)/uncharacterized protein YbbK (DUF523 family)